jgi:hypothetical protein
MKKIKRFTFTVVAALAALLFQPSVVRADENRDATITWTKHVTAFLPSGGEIFGEIAGTAAGDLGVGTLVGDAFNPVERLSDGSVTFEAEYHFVGSKHSLTIHFRTVQGPDPSGVIRGVITGFVKDGWLKGNVVVGGYTGYACDEGVNLTCFDGTFTIKKGSKAQN